MKSLSILLMLFLPLVSYSKVSPLKAKLSKDGTTLQLSLGKYKNKLDLQVPKGMEVEAPPYIIDAGGVHVITVEFADFEYASSTVYAVNDKAEKLWSLTLGTFNPSKPLVEKEHIYFSSLGRVWKVNKKSGKVLWHHDNLYKDKRFKFNGKEKISRKGSLVIFSPKLAVNDQTGKIVEVKK